MGPSDMRTGGGRGTWRKAGGDLARTLIGRLTGTRRRQAGERIALSEARNLHRQGKLAEAADACRHLISADPDDLDALLLLGMLELQRRNFPEAVEMISRALQIRPTDPTAWYHLGIGLFRSGHFDEAAASYDEAVRLDPEEARFWKDRGAVLRRLDRLEDALESYDRALDLNPGYLEAQSGRGTALYDLKRAAEAIESFDRILAVKPDDGSALYNRAQCRLQIGDFKGGWPGFEWRDSGLRDMRERPYGPAPRWRGEEPLAGKSILLWAELGLGEAIQFCRFASPVAAKGAAVILSVLDAREAKTLLPVMESLEGPSRVLVPGEPVPKTDYHCPLRSLPLALNIELADLAAQRQYLYADPERVVAWSARLGPRGLPRIGLVWSGNPNHANDHNRSIPLRQFVDLVDGPFEFVCLQKDVREADRPWLEQRPGIRQFCEELNDFGDTAALLQHMDLVISVDTSVAHLAGALGRPTWIPLSFSQDWRWMLDRDDSPWYPTVRLFRQPAMGDWDSVLAAVMRALADQTFPVLGPETTSPA